MHQSETHSWKQFVPSKPPVKTQNKQLRSQNRAELRHVLQQHHFMDIVREVVQLLVDHPDVVSPMALLQQEYGHCMTFQTEDSSKRFSDEKVSFVAVHEDFMRLSSENLAKDAKIRVLQTKLAEAEDMCVKLREAFSNSASGAQRHSSAETPSNDEANQLRELNLQLSEHIELLENNISMGFVYSDVEIKNVIADLELEKEQVMSRNLQLAQVLYETDFERNQLHKRVTHLENEVADLHTAKGSQEKELQHLRGEYDRLKRALKESRGGLGV